MRFPVPRVSRRLLVDIGLAVIAWLVLVLPLPINGIAHAPATIGWSTLMVASLALRRCCPLWAVGVCAAAGFGMIATLTKPVPTVVVVLVIVYSAARHMKERSGLVVLPLGIAASFAGPLTWVTSLPEPQRFLFGGMLATVCLSLTLTAYLLGQRVRSESTRKELTQALAEERFLAGSRNSQQASEIADNKARSEVARELHDVVAHSLSVIVVQAEGAKALAAKKPEAAIEALNVIATTGRSSIGEMRRIVSLLRGESDAAFGPTPSLPQIPEMVAKAGSRITLEMPAEVPAVPDSLGLTVYRVVQESVTNFLKHAGPTAVATVVVQFAPDAIQIRVSDDGIGVHRSPDGPGAGVRGMRERVMAMGGTFKAGPRTGGGYEVRARIPMPSQLGRSWLKGGDRDTGSVG
ncbi:MAG: histidine kinase [Arachnia propionica]|uniref:sensor histidine kinase n=1 Tax=Arachnia propionica TaxID=1750 RepID=UPI0026F5C1A1|nr:histidine kinase [Arachnia propionica]